MERDIHPLKIGELARRAGISVDAVRFYEERGVLPAAERTPSGYRLFPAAAVERLAFVGRAKNLGFSLDDIVELLSLRECGASDSHRVREKLDERLAEVDRRIGELQRLRGAIASLAGTCDGTRPTSECPILEAFSGRGEGECCHGSP